MTKLASDQHRPAVRFVAMRQTIAALGRGDFSLEQTLQHGVFEQAGDYEGQIKVDVVAMNVSS